MQKYIENIEQLVEPTFQQIRTLADKSISHLSKNDRDELWTKLNHGVDLLDSHELMCQYLWSFGNMHEGKIIDALTGLNSKLRDLNKSVFDGEFDIVDWGCGQGLATVVLFDYLKKYNPKTFVNQIILIEPSPMALERAKLHVNAYQKDSNKIRTIEKYLNDVTNKDVETDGFRPVIHFFSNILDINEIDFKDVAAKLDNSVINDNYIITVGPLNAGNRRIDAFYDYFKVPIIYEKSESQFYYGSNYPCTYKAKVYKLEFNENGNLIPIEFYPSVQFHASFELDCMKNNRVEFSKTNSEEFKRIINNLTRYETSTPFDIGASVYDDVDSILAVLNNIVTRGLPTKASPFIEDTFEKLFDYSKKQIIRGEIIYSSQKCIDYENLLLWINTSINSLAKIDYSTINISELQLLICPIAIARIQKTVLEALMTGKLSFDQQTWKVLVQENDVPCAAIAFKDLEQMFNNLTQLSSEYHLYIFPNINLEIISLPEFVSSPLHLNAKTTNKVLPIQLKSEYDLVIDIAVLQLPNIDKNTFSQFKCKNNCYFNIRSSAQQRTVRGIYTSKLIQYRDIVSKDIQGKYSEIQGTKDNLKYFLQLIFRKEEFRPGQLPILNRALQNKPVIGLLPTGGGKSLTYQLAAMLQPGVTIVIDPLISLMQDQYDGLISAGIDCCTYINSKVPSDEKRIREIQMESSQMLFVFLSPERLGIYKFRERLKNMYNLSVYFSYGVIDEVHCVSEWGHDFRTNYLHLGRNLYKFVRACEDNISLFGLTATASFDVLADVERELSAEGAFKLDANTIVRFENTNRLELQYKIEKVNVEFETDSHNYDLHHQLDPNLTKPVDLFSSKNSKAFQNSKNKYLTNFIQTIPEYLNELQSKEEIEKIESSFKVLQDVIELQKTDLIILMPTDFYEKKNLYNQAGIVFCPHKNKTGIAVSTNHLTLSKTFKDIGTFIGGDDTGTSMKNLELFRDNKLPVMIATKAFGMGIDKPNVRFTINMNYSSSLESFVQEAGRAGRDRKMALSTIFLSDYKLGRINDNCPDRNFVYWEIKGRWFHYNDLLIILKHYNWDIDTKYIDICSPKHDLVQLDCEKKNNSGQYILSNGLCKVECSINLNCKVKDVPRNIRNSWLSEIDLLKYLKDSNLSIDKKFYRYQNADYESVMYFYKGNFKGADIENEVMFDLLIYKPIKVFYGNDVEINHKDIKDMSGFLTSILDANLNDEVVSLIPYIPSDIENEIIGNDSDIAKAIYRMSCIGLIEDFTQDYNKKHFRIVSKRKKENEYYNGLKSFLLRYFTNERAEIERSNAKSYELKPPYKESTNYLQNEIYRCLCYLTDFVYDKISIKRKRSIDEMRNFCIQGIDDTKDWKIINRELKDDLYYYFNSKYARVDYEADNGQNYSLTIDIDFGKIYSENILFKYLRINEPEILGVSTEIDNVKHLQGAVKLIRRSVTGKNPTISLLNVFCILFLGTKGNENLEHELYESYIDGMLEFEKGMENPVKFWQFFEEYNKKIYSDSYKEELSVLKQEIEIKIHSKHSKQIIDKYLQ